MLASPVMATVFASLYFRTQITPVMIAGGLLAFGVVMIVLMRNPPAAGPLALFPAARTVIYRLRSRD